LFSSETSDYTGRFKFLYYISWNLFHAMLSRYFEGNNKADADLIQLDVLLFPIKSRLHWNSDFCLK